MSTIICEVAGCGLPAFIRLGAPENGHAPQENDLCRKCAAEYWEKAKGGIASLGVPSPTFGPPGVAIWAEGHDVVRRRSTAADRDDAAAIRDI